MAIRKKNISEFSASGGGYGMPVADEPDQAETRQNDTQDESTEPVDGEAELENVEVIAGTADSDELYGGKGDDTFTYEGGFDVYAGGAGADTLVLKGSRGSYEILRQGLDEYQIIAKDGEIWFREFENIKFGDGTELDLASYSKTKGTTVDDILFTRHQGSYINGGRGDDAIYGHNGHDVLIGGDGNDSIEGYAGGDIIRGGNGHDYLWGYDGAFIYGGSGDDNISSNDGTLTGGLGSDTFAPVGEYSTITITDFTPGEDYVSLQFAVDFDGAPQEWEIIDWGNEVEITNGATTVILQNMIVGLRYSIMDYGYLSVN